MTDIYELLKRDHRELETLMETLLETEGDSDARAENFARFKELLDAHSHAEERAFYSQSIQDEDAREKTAHGTKEHCEASELLEELEKTDRSSSGWLLRFRKLKEEVEHHIKEEENELFPKARKALDAEQSATAARRFEEYKRQELSA